MKIASNNLQIIFLSVLSAVVIKFIPVIFSPEEFARIFYPYGGLVHEAIGVIIVSAIFLLIFIFHKNTRFVNLFKIASSTSILISIYGTLRYLYYLGLTHTVNQDVFKIETFMYIFPGKLIFIILYMFFEVIYYLLLLTLPFILVAIIKKMTCRKQIVLMKQSTNMLG